MPFAELVKQYIWVFFISMLPLVELRGAIPVGILAGLNPWITYLVAIVGNILPVPFLILFSKKMLTWLATFKKIGPFFQKILDKGNEKALKFGKYELLGLLLFVAIPIPGTGAWTGSLIAATLQLRIVPSFICISLGVCIAGVLMWLASAGLLGAIGALF